MQINSKSNKNNYKTTNFKGEIVKNSSYKQLKKVSKKLPILTDTLEAVEKTIKNYPEKYNLKIDIYNDRRPSTESLGALKSGHFTWIPVTDLYLRTAFGEQIKRFDGHDNYYLVIDFLKKLINPLGEVSGTIFPELTRILPSIISTTEKNSGIFDNYKKRAIDPKTGNIDYRRWDYGVEFYIKCSKHMKATPLEIFSFLQNVSTDPVLSKEMARQFSNDPREGKNLKSRLIEYLGGGEAGEELFNAWYYDEKNGYRKAYKEYYNDEIWTKANSFKDLVIQSPNISSHALECFCKDKNIEPILGSIPKDIGARDDFIDLINKLKNWHKNATKMIKETNIDDSIYSIPFKLTINNKNYDVKPLTRGHSLKLKFWLTIDNNPDKSYVIKFAPYNAVKNSERNKQIRENQDTRPDMPYINSMLDFYLKLNNCPNAPDIQYFDYKAEASLYKATKGEYPDFPVSVERNIYNFRNYKPVADIYKLGVELNDIYHTNFLIDENGVCKAIDTGHAQFNNIFRPSVTRKHFSLSNFTGREL